MSISYVTACGASHCGASKLVDTLARTPGTPETHLAIDIATKQHYPSGPLLEWLLRHRSQPISLTPVSAYLICQAISNADLVIQSTLNALSLSACAACWQELRQRYLALDLPVFPSSRIEPSHCTLSKHLASAREQGVA